MARSTTDSNSSRGVGMSVDTPLPIPISSVAGLIKTPGRTGIPAASKAWAPKLLNARPPELTPNRKKYGWFKLKSSTPTLLPTMFLANL